MIRLFLRLLNIYDYEICASCETLKQQLAIANEDRQRLTETLLSIVKPKEFEAAPTEISPIIHSSVMFSKRRAAMEAKDREEAKILNTSKNLAQPDDQLKQISPITPIGVEELERELGINGG